MENGAATFGYSSGKNRATHLVVRIYDSNGRLMATQADAAEVQTFRMPASGAYLVQVADHPAQRVVVVR